MKTVRLFFFFLLIFRAFPQATPPQYPYPDPLPISGDIPSLHSLKVTKAITPTAYEDERPVVWDDFVGGGYHTCLNGTERDNILQGRRKEGMLVWVAFDNHTYRLASDLTTWTDLGILAAGGSVTTIYTGNGTLAGNRTITGSNFNLDLVGLGNFSALANTSITLAAPTITLNGGSFTRINNSGPYPFLFAAAPSVAGSTHQLLARNPSTGEVTFTPDATIGGSSGVYRGVTSGTPGFWVAATSALTPPYSSASQPPEATVAVLKFPSNSVGNDTLQLGDSTTGIAIKRKDGSAVQADDITAGQYILFTRAGTLSGAHWTCESCGQGGSPSPDVNGVVSVDTISELINSTANVVITRGYYTIGDGGHGAYRLDTAAVDATNTVTTFEAATGRYFLMQSGSISALQAGAPTDGTTDAGPYLQALLDACPNLTARIDPFPYRVVGQLNPPDDVKVIARGATLTIETTSECGVAVSSNFIWDGGTVVDAAQDGGSSDNVHCPFRFGDYSGVSNAGVSNSTIRNVTFYSTGYDGVGALVTQNSHNITIEHFEIPNNSSMGGGIEVHWGYVTSGNAALGTRHPHGVKVSQGHIGNLTHSDSAGLIVSASYSLQYDNVTIDQCRYPIFAVCGDFGFHYSGFQGQQLGSVVYRTVTCLDSLLAGAYVRGLDSDSIQRTVNYVIDSCTLIGPNAGAGLGGLYLDNVRNLTVQNSVISVHQYGTVLTNGCSNIGLIGNLFTTNALGGIVLSDPSSSGVTVRGNRLQNNCASLSGTNAAAIRIVAGSNHRIIDNDIGNPITEANQEVGILCIPPASNITITGNNVINVKGGGVSEGYYLGNAADFGHLWLVSGNQSNSTTLMAVPQNLPFLVRGKYRTFAGTTTPSVGTFIKGDRVEFNEATSTPFAIICTTGGSSGSWATIY